MVALMIDRFRVQPQLSHFAARLFVIFFIKGVGKEKLGNALLGVNLDRYGHRGSYQYSVVARFCNHEGAFLETESLSQRRRQDKCPTFSDP